MAKFQIIILCPDCHSRDLEVPDDMFEISKGEAHESKEELVDEENPEILESAVVDNAEPTEKNEMSPYSEGKTNESEKDSKEVKNWFSLYEEQKLKLTEFF